MRLDFSAPIKALDGQPLMQDGKPVTLASVASGVLLMAFPDEGQTLSADEKIQRFRLAEKVVGGGERELKVEDIALIKKLVAKAYGPLVVGRVFDLIEPNSA
jgi:hypothetical protein